MSDLDSGKAKVNWGLRVMAYSACALLLSFGLCAVSARASSTWAEGPFLAGGILCLVVSLLGLFVGFVMALVSGIRR
jgi:hypothetical protein